MRLAALLLAVAGMCSQARATAIIEIRGIIDGVSGPNGSGVQPGDEWGLWFPLIKVPALGEIWNPPRITTLANGDVEYSCVFCDQQDKFPLTSAATVTSGDAWTVVLDPMNTLVRVSSGGGGMWFFWGAPNQDEFTNRFSQDRYVDNPYRLDGTVTGYLTSARLVLTPEPSTFLLSAPVLLLWGYRSARARAHK